MMNTFERLDDSLRERIARHLRRFERQSIERPGLKHAAVALTIVPGSAGEPSFLLTQRASTLRGHSGQFALPGGRVDPGEDAVSAARRELREELGVALGPESTLGLLDDFATRSGYVITPVVLWGPEVGALVPNPHEVAVAYCVPLRELYRPDVPILCPLEHSEQPVLALPLVGTQVYTPTAAIIYQLREIALEGRATRVSHFEQPPFTWR